MARHVASNAPTTGLRTSAFSTMDIGSDEWPDLMAVVIAVADCHETGGGRGCQKNATSLMSPLTAGMDRACWEGLMLGRRKQAACNTCQLPASLERRTGAGLGSFFKSRKIRAARTGRDDGLAVTVLNNNCGCTVARTSRHRHQGYHVQCRLPPQHRVCRSGG